MESFGSFEEGLTFLLSLAQRLVPKVKTPATNANATPNFDKKARLDLWAGVFRVNSFGISLKVSVS